MEFKQLEAFTAVVELKSFSKAAGRLFLTQPTVSAHIQSLERELGTRLILRNTKALTLSDSGECLYRYAKEMLSLRDKALTDLGQGASTPCGTITIAASTIPSQYILPGVLAEFRKQYPEVTFNMIKCDSGMVIKYLEDNRADIGVTGTISDTSNCSFEPFAKDKLVVVTPNTKEYSKIQSFDPTMLLAAPFIVREEESGTRKEYEHYLSSIGINPKELNVVAQMDNVDSIKSSISSGLGISIMSRMSVAEYCKLGLVHTATINESSIGRNLYLVRLKNKHLPAIVERFMAKVREYGSSCGSCSTCD